MKRLTALILTFVILILSVGCQETPNAKAFSFPITALKAWSGEFSEEELRSAISEYQSNYKNVALVKSNISCVSFETEFDVSSCSVGRVSRVDDTDVETELKGYIDCHIPTNCDGKTVTVSVDWWYSGEDSWVNDHLVWSYLVCVKDTDGNSHYYYFRVDYSAYAQ